MIAPLAVTLGLEAMAEARFAEQCAAHHGHPHVVLFRALPAERERQVRVDLVTAAGPPFPVGVAGVLPLPTGAAYAIVSPELGERHRLLQQRWWDGLDERDRRRLRAHVVVQSGATPAEARATAAVLRRAFRPHEVRAEAFVLWQAGEPWRPLARIPFADRC